MLQQGVHPGWGCTHAAVGKGAASMLQRRGGGCASWMHPPFPQSNSQLIILANFQREQYRIEHIICRDLVSVNYFRGPLL